VEARSDSGDTGTATIFPDGSVHLPLPFFAWLLEVPVLAQIRQDTGLFTFLLEPLQRPFEALVIVNDDFWHSLTHPSRPGKGRNPNKLENVLGVVSISKQENVRNVGSVGNVGNERKVGDVRNVRNAVG
jgi:hypothetical protein